MSSTESGEQNESENLLVRPSREELNSARNPRAKHALQTWYRRFCELKRYRDTHGDCQVPQKYAENKSLGIWVNKQRCTRDNLSDRKRAALELIGFEWGKKKGRQAWDEKYAELEQYKLENGHCKSK